MCAWMISNLILPGTFNPSPTIMKKNVTTTRYSNLTVNYWLWLVAGRQSILSLCLGRCSQHSQHCSSCLQRCIQDCCHVEERKTKEKLDCDRAKQWISNVCWGQWQFKKESGAWELEQYPSSVVACVLAVCNKTYHWKAGLVVVNLLHSIIAGTTSLTASYQRPCRKVNQLCRRKRKRQTARRDFYGWSCFMYKESHGGRVRPLLEQLVKVLNVLDNVLSNSDKSTKQQDDGRREGNHESKFSLLGWFLIALGIDDSSDRP